MLAPWASWCMGMPNHKNRNKNKLRRRAHIENKRARQQAQTTQRRETKAERDAIEAAWRGKRADPFAEALKLFSLNEEQKAALKILVERSSDGFIAEMAGPLKRILWLNLSWTRPLEGWQPKGRSRRAELRSLIDHLFVRYPTPAFLYQAFDGDADRLHEDAWERRFLLLFTLVASGGRRKEIPGQLGAPLTKRMITQFLSAKARQSPLEALRMAQVMASCEDKGRARDLTSALMDTPFGRDRYPHGEDRAQEVIGWITRQPDLPLAEVGPLVDYIQHAQGEEGWSLKGRTVTSLNRDARAWHAELARIRKASGQIFPESSFRGWDRLEVKDLDRDLYWRLSLKEISNSKALSAEGRAMGHCVYSYARQIAHGRTSIWSLRRHAVAIYDGVEYPVGGEERLLTIEVRNGARSVPQARGRFNRKAKEWEKVCLRRWARTNGLSLSQWI